MVFHFSDDALERRTGDSPDLFDLEYGAGRNGLGLGEGWQSGVGNHRIS
mgnify:CR=1 FL=1